MPDALLSSPRYYKHAEATFFSLCFCVSVMFFFNFAVALGLLFLIVKIFNHGAYTSYVIVHSTCSALYCLMASFPCPHHRTHTKTI